MSLTGLFVQCWSGCAVAELRWLAGLPESEREGHEAILDPDPLLSESLNMKSMK